MDGEHVVMESPTVTELAEAEEEQIDIEGDEDIPVLQEESSQHAAEVYDADQHTIAEDDAGLGLEQSHEEPLYQEEPAEDDSAAAGDVSYADEAEHAPSVAEHGNDAAQPPAADAPAAAASEQEQLEEWQRMNIPQEWLPSPTFRVRRCLPLLSLRCWSPHYELPY